MNEVMSPEDYQMLLQLGGQNTQDAASMQAMLQQAQNLRASNQAPEMRGSGRGYQTAAHPLEHLSAMLGQGLAHRKDQGALDLQKGMGARTAQQNQMVLASLLRQRQQPQAQPNPFQAPSGAQMQGIDPQM